MSTLELRVPPVILTLVFGVVVWLLARFAPSLGFDFGGRGWIVVMLIAAGVVVIALGLAEFRRARTTVSPVQPETSSAIVSSGIYRWSRNPMYAGFLLILAGWALHLANLAGLPALPAFVLYMNRYQIHPEERALSAKFGSEYMAYARRVRRWL